MKLKHSRQASSRGFYVVGSMILNAGIAGSALAQPTITNLGVLPGGNSSGATGVSADGTAVAGSATIAGDSTSHAFRWTRAGGMQDLGTLAEFAGSDGFAISADGTAVTGSSWIYAFRWTVAGGMENLGTFGWASAVGRAVNADGSAVAGYVRDENPVHILAFRWTGDLQDIGHLPGGTDAQAYAISADGSVVAGAGIAEFGERAFRWENGSMQDLGPFLGGYSWAYGISADGAVIVGVGGYPSVHAFRWTSAGGFQDLGVPEGCRASGAFAISGDGAAVTGWIALSEGGSRPALWRQELGMVDLHEYLTAAGVDLTGWILSSATGLSSDGSAICGSGRYNGAQRAWLVTGLPVPCRPDFDGDGFVTGIDFDLYVQAFEAGSMASDFDGDGFVTGSDFDAYVVAFEQGC